MAEPTAVLVVDDDQSLLRVVERTLAPLCQVRLASSGALALRLLERGEKPELILLDVDMPDMDGYETHKRLKALPGCGDIPVVYLTALAAPENELRGIGLGAVDYIKKPFVSEILLARVARHLAEGRKLREKGTLDEEKLAGLPDPLTPRELETARLLARFYSDKKIGETLHLSAPYVKRLVASVRGKLSLEHRDEIRKFLK